MQNKKHIFQDYLKNPKMVSYKLKHNVDIKPQTFNKKFEKKKRRLKI